jgi:hypothetical protein
MNGFFGWLEKNYGNVLSLDDMAFITERAKQEKMPVGTLRTEDIIKIFRENTECGIQYNKCPCNTCFHAQEADFRHICWLIVLGLRGDYDRKEIIKLIKQELKGE